MNFWDSSALLPLFIQEETTRTILELKAGSREIVIWTLTPVEVVSAVSRSLRLGRLSAEDAEKAISYWQGFLSELYLVKNIEGVKWKAMRLLRLHSLRAADACQLGAALLACEDNTRGQTFFTLDAKLAQAASKEGFRVLPV